MKATSQHQHVNCLTTACQVSKGGLTHLQGRRIGAVYLYLPINLCADDCTRPLLKGGNRLSLLADQRNDEVWSQLMSLALRAED